MKFIKLTTDEGIPIRINMDQIEVYMPRKEGGSRLNLCYYTDGDSHYVVVETPDEIDEMVMR